MMLSIIVAPPWFRGIDCIFEYFGIVVFLLIAFFAYKATRITNDKKTKWLFISFLLIAGSYLIKAFKDLNFYFPVEREVFIGNFHLKYASIAIIQSEVLINAISRILFLLGLVGLYFLITRSEEKRHVFLLVFFTTIVTYISSFIPHLFHLTNVVLLAEISYFYFKKTKLKQPSQKMIMTAFLCLMLSQVLFLTFLSRFYVNAKILELIAFIFFLIAYSLVVFGTKSKK